MKAAPSVTIGGRRIAHDEPVYLIAELSANHGGSKDTALRTIEAAKKAGADAIKLQTYTPDTLTLKSDGPLFVVKTKNQWAGRTLHDLYAEAMTPWEWHAELKSCAESLGMQLFSTPFDPTATELLHAIDVPAYKIASFELVDLPLIEHTARRGKPMIMSTGMASLGDIESALAASRGAGNDQIVLLRCVSSYPARPDDMNLQSFEVLSKLGTVIGLSDHTRDATVALASVALGARVIEKHFILDRSVGGPDSFFSLEPSEFRSMVDAVRAAEAALGAPRFGPSPDERASTAFRRSLFVARDVRAGEVLTHESVRSVRPSNGLAPRHLPAVLGRVAARDRRFGEPLTWDMVGGEPARSAITLRAATADDGEFLLALRNEPSVRAASFSKDLVSAEAHRAWLAETLRGTERKLFVVEHEGQRVGQIRLDQRDPTSHEVSVSVASAARGRGVASAALWPGGSARRACSRASRRRTPRAGASSSAPATTRSWSIPREPCAASVASCPTRDASWAPDVAKSAPHAPGFSSQTSKRYVITSSRVREASALGRRPSSCSRPRTSERSSVTKRGVKPAARNTVVHSLRRRRFTNELRLEVIARHRRSE